MVLCRVFRDGVESWSEEGESTAAVLRKVAAADDHSKEIVVVNANVSGDREAVYRATGTSTVAGVS